MEWTKNWELVGKSAVAGGQGSVRKVKHRITGQLGALKEMHPQYAKKMQNRRRLAREIEALRKVAGSGVPAVLDSNESDLDNLQIPLFIVQSWVDGENLSDYIGGRPLPLDDALPIVRQLGDILERIHGLNIIHRDIKPANIIFGTDGNIYLVDFGIAWIDVSEADTEDHLTRINEEIGNRFLRLPDLAPGTVKNDPRTDLTFLVGILFYLLTTLPPVFLSDTNGLPPHESQANAFPADLKADQRWIALQRFFRVGFEAVIGFRHQSAVALKDGLEKISSMPNKLSQLDDKVSEFKDFMEQKAIQLQLNIQRELVAITHDMESFLNDHAYAHGLQPIFNAGGANLIASMHVQGYFTMHVSGVTIPNVRVRYEIRPYHADASMIIATYALNGTEEVYYKGSAVDTESLREAVIVQQEVILGAMLDDLRLQIHEKFVSIDQTP